MHPFTVRIEGLTKIYEESASHRPVLKEVNATFEGGEFTVLLGRSGSGKSTMISLLQRLYDYSDGDILVDGRSLVSVARAGPCPWSRR